MPKKKHQPPRRNQVLWRKAYSQHVWGCMEEFSEVESQRRFNTQRLWPMENSAFFSPTMKFDGHLWKTKFLVRSVLSLYLQQQQQQQPPPWFTGSFPVTSVDLPTNRRKSRKSCLPKSQSSTPLANHCGHRGGVATYTGRQPVDADLFVYLVEIQK